MYAAITNRYSVRSELDNQYHQRYPFYHTSLLQSIRHNWLAQLLVPLNKKQMALGQIDLMVDHLLVRGAGRFVSSGDSHHPALDVVKSIVRQCIAGQVIGKVIIVNLVMFAGFHGTKPLLIDSVGRG